MIDLAITFSGPDFATGNFTLGIQPANPPDGKIGVYLEDVALQNLAAASIAIVRSLLYEVSVYIHGHNMIPRKDAFALAIFGKAISSAVDVWNAKVSTSMDMPVVMLMTSANPFTLDY